jgi:glycosyltransferase involved in cell wall biosynthesis
MIKKRYKKIVIDASRNRSGGAIIYLKNFIKHLNLENTQIKEIIIFSHKDILDQIPNRSFLIKQSHPLLEMNRFFQIIWQFFYLTYFLKKNKTDILYSTSSTTFCNYSNSILFNQNILSFDKQAFNQIPFSLEKIKIFIIKFVQIYSLNNAKEVIFLSDYTRKTISKHLRKNISYNIIPHGIEENFKKIDLEKLNNTTWDYNSKKKIKIIYVSPLFLYKNHQTVVKAYSRLKKKYDNLDIEFIGNYKHNLKLYNNLIDENSLINESHFIGELNRKDLIKTLIESDIFVFASSTETFGISLLEAMAVGMPIVCSDKSSLPEVLQNGGLYFDPKSDLQLSEQIELLITNESLRKNKSQQARKLALKFSWDQNTEQFCKILNRLSK